MKKVLIEIQDDHKRVIDNLVEDGKGYLLPYEVENRMALAIRNGKVLSEMTNGDVIKAMFPNCEQKEHMHNGYFEMYFDNDLKNASYMRVSKDWWRAKYKGV